MATLTYAYVKDLDHGDVVLTAGSVFRFLGRTGMREPGWEQYRVQAWHFHHGASCGWRFCPQRDTWTNPVTTSIGLLTPDQIVQLYRGPGYRDPAAEF